MVTYSVGSRPRATDFNAFAARTVPLKGAYVVNTGNPIATTSGTTELDLAKLQLTGLTLTTGRYYEYRFQLAFTKTTGGDTFDLKLRVNTAVSGTQIGQVGVNITDGLTIGIRELGIMFKGDPTYTSLYLSVVRSAGAGTLSYYGAAGSNIRTWAQVWDRGDTTNWTDVA